VLQIKHQYRVDSVRELLRLKGYLACAMGGTQSKMPDPAVHQLKNKQHEASLSLEEEYILIDGTRNERMDTSKLKDQYTCLLTPSKALPSYEQLCQHISIAAAGQWEKELLQDPKVLAA